MNLTIAGRDTTAQALSWTTYFLLSHPAERAKVLVACAIVAAVAVLTRCWGFVPLR